MTLQSSGTISILDLRNEYGGSAPDSIGEYSPCIGITTGTITSMSQFYGQSNPPTAYGQVYCGGYYVGTVKSCDPNRVWTGTYYIVLSPIASGQATCTFATGCWAIPIGVNNTIYNDGYYSTRVSPLTGSSYPAAYWTATRTINGYSDWYLGSSNEMSYVYYSNCYVPAGQQMCNEEYWTASWNYTYPSLARTWSFPEGRYMCQLRVTAYKTRALRRVRAYF